MALIKVLKDDSTILFPFPTEMRELELKSEDNREKFTIYVNRRGNLDTSLCYFERYGRRYFL